MRKKIYLERGDCISLLRRSITNGTTPYGISVVEEWMEGADNRISELESALREIEEHPVAHKKYVEHGYSDGLIDGHKACAEIARRAREGRGGNEHN